MPRVRIFYLQLHVLLSFFIFYFFIFFLFFSFPFFLLLLPFPFILLHNADEANTALTPKHRATPSDTP